MKEVKLKLMKADICKNMTAFVIFPVDARLRSAYGKIIMEMDHSIEQVGFISPSYEEKPLRLDMAGGEFCANATRAYGLYAAICDDIQGMDSQFCYVSGAKEALEVRVNTDINYAMVDIPFEEEIQTVKIEGKEYPVVPFPGIHHMIVEGENPCENRARELMTSLEQQVSSEAYGVLFFDRDAMKVVPYVKVVESQTFMKESSCGSGSAALGYYLAEKKDRNFTFHFEGGDIDVECKDLDGNYFVCVGSEVSLGPVEVISIQAQVDSYYIDQYYKAHPQKKRPEHRGI